MRNSKAKKIICVIIALCLITFGIISLCWYLRYLVLYKPLTKREGFSKEYSNLNYYAKHYINEDDPDKQFTAGFRTPNFLNFHGNLNVTVDAVFDSGHIKNDDYYICFSYHPKIFDDIDGQFEWTVIETDEKGNETQHGKIIYTDENLRFIREINIGDTYLSYDYCLERMNYVYDIFLDPYGEDVIN